jgi:hypothetical protein
MHRAMPHATTQRDRCMALKTVGGGAWYMMGAMMPMIVLRQRRRMWFQPALVGGLLAIAYSTVNVQALAQYVTQLW